MRIPEKKSRIVWTVLVAAAFLGYFALFLRSAYDVDIRLLPYLNWIFDWWGECFGLENIDFNTFLLECLDERYYLFVIVSDVISEIAINNENIFDVFEDRLYERYKNYDKEDNLLVYRRSRWKRKKLLI